MRLLLAIIALLSTAVLSAQEQVADTTFSVKRGFFTSPFSVQINTETTGATIIYTLDGTDPRYSSTSASGVTPVSVQIDPNSE